MLGMTGIDGAPVHPSPGIPPPMPPSHKLASNERPDGLFWGPGGGCKHPPAPPPSDRPRPP